ncbi:MULTISPECIES: polyprenyl synthetase family protein [unclassified Clostridium]|jgi:polyprenyl synthetase|uniref:polyprenyl synthetase family protein n=1 Tax=unclassified Clostridium TaxID=2614128 RepID=UPI0025BD8D51|nr:farnesyl diphosphate synthase [Clostridium sp.]MCI6692989.1 polyprenyl synthetase family protein [Clostridium sp.]MDY2630192.1 farnesyl diphosphate synthase [Clostridium sp.]MDY4251752.1 farnesyl diphosphate synthase [Clostridium sp.]MDY6226293.1 farnesyl diphosphate synthase [Clostridium sp.]
MSNKISYYRDYINNYLDLYFKDKGSYNRIIYDAAGYSLNIGGKRIRPILFLLTYGLYKDNYKDVIEMASAIEMIHTYSLIHDDLPCMDNDDLRRGMPTNHKKFGESIAVLAGDMLLNEAMSLLMLFSLKNGEKALLASREISESAGPEGMIGGQVVDIIDENKEISKEELIYMHNKKTGELIRSSIVSAAILADAPKKDIKILNDFGLKLGLAFQIKDDILDIVGDASKLGKNTNCDINKSNFISLFGLEYCERECIKLTNECIELLKSLSVDAIDLNELTLELLNREF